MRWLRNWLPGVRRLRTWLPAVRWLPTRLCAVRWLPTWLSGVLCLRTWLPSVRRLPTRLSGVRRLRTGLPRVGRLPTRLRTTRRLPTRLWPPVCHRRLAGLRLPARPVSALRHLRGPALQHPARVLRWHPSGLVRATRRHRLLGRLAARARARAAGTSWAAAVRHAARWGCEAARGWGLLWGRSVLERGWSGVRRERLARSARESGRSDVVLGATYALASRLRAEPRRRGHAVSALGRARRLARRRSRGLPLCFGLVRDRTLRLLGARPRRLGRAVLGRRRRPGWLARPAVRSFRLAVGLRLRFRPRFRRGRRHGCRLAPRFFAARLRFGSRLAAWLLTSRFGRRLAPWLFASRLGLGRRLAAWLLAS